MKIEAVTVCVDYSDHLKCCLDNREKLDRWLIITYSKDINTIKLCEDEGLEYITTDVFYDNGAHFAKGRAINVGLELIQPTDWILQLDADQRLPDNFLEIADETKLDSTCIYGAARAHKGVKRVEINHLTGEVHRRPLIGFFQMWHSSCYMSYPESSTHAGDDDEEMSMRYSYPDKWKYVDIVTDDVSGDCCNNWYGRRLHRRANVKR